MNKEDRLLVELTYGIDMSFTTITEYIYDIRNVLPPQFLLDYGYVDPKTRSTSLYVLENIFTDGFREKLVEHLLDYRSKQ